jgi:hypothetical protein
MQMGGLFSFPSCGWRRICIRCRLTQSLATDIYPVPAYTFAGAGYVSGAVIQRILIRRRFELKSSRGEMAAKYPKRKTLANQKST